MQPSDIIDALTKYPRGAEACGGLKLVTCVDGVIVYHNIAGRDNTFQPDQEDDCFTILGIVVERADEMGVEVIYEGGYVQMQHSIRDQKHPTRLHALLAGIEAAMVAAK
jgi:hypothetical protein